MQGWTTRRCLDTLGFNCYRKLAKYTATVIMHLQLKSLNDDKSSTQTPL